MGTTSQHRNAGLVLTLISMVFAAIVVVAGGWLLLSWWLGMGQYVQSLP